MATLTEGDKLSILAVLDAALLEAEGREPGDDNYDVETDEGDCIAAVREYIDSTQPLDRTALAEVAYAFLAGIEHESADTIKTQPAFRALRKAGLSL